MTVTFFDRQDESNPNNAKQIDNSDQLLKLLTSLRNRAPFFVELLGENGYALLVGIGPVTGCIQYSPGNGTLPYLMAVGDSAIQNPSTKDQDYVEFLTSDAPTPVSKRPTVRRGATRCCIFPRNRQSHSDANVGRDMTKGIAPISFAVRANIPIWRRISFMPRRRVTLKS
jgi:hypothetical protein